MRAFIILALLAASPALANDTFEAKAQGAQPLKRIESLVWALTAACDAGDDTQQRQCRRVRDARASELVGATLLVEADKDAFDVGAWSAQKKSVPLSLRACVRCAGVELDGKTYYVVADPVARFKGGKLEAAPLHDNAKAFSDETAANAFAKAAGNARVQMVVKVPARPKLTVDGKPVIALDLVAYRVFSPCDGSIVLARPASGPAEADKKQCGPVTKTAATGPTLAQLTPAMIHDAMKPVVAKGAACFEKFGVAGKAKLKITIAGDGTIVKYEQQGDFANTPTGGCIDEAIKNVTFPRSKKAKTSVTFPLMLQ